MLSKEEYDNYDYSKELMKCKTDEEMELANIKNKIYCQQTELNRLIDAIVEFNFAGFVGTGPFYDDLYHKQMQIGFEKIEKVKNKKLKDKLTNILMFGEDIPFKKMTPKESLESELKYIESLIGWAKSHLSHIENDKKKKIVMDNLRKHELWFFGSNNLYRVSTILNKKEMKSLKKELEGLPKEERK